MDVRTRLGWIRLYEELGNAGIVCRRCGISRPTLRKWWRRYQEQASKGSPTAAAGEGGRARELVLAFGGRGNIASLVTGL
jgi:transposase-like protein